MKAEDTRFRNEERLAAACLLSMVGGFTDAIHWHQIRC